MLTDLKQYQALQNVNNDYWIEPVAGKLNGERAHWSPIPENSTQPIIIPRSVICHTNAGSTPAKWWQLFAWMSRDTVSGESHFDIDNDGNIGQLMSIYRRADCNYSANSWTYDGKLYGAISIETGDLGSATVETTTWNLLQLEGILAVCTALAVQHGTGCNEVVTWDGKGIDYHSKFPYLGVGIGKAWTNVTGKTCPGRARKLQMAYIRSAVFDRVVAYIQRCEVLGVPHGLV